MNNRFTLPIATYSCVGNRLEPQHFLQYGQMQLEVANEDIMIVLTLAALLGGIATAAWMADYGAIAVIVTMPFGGSLAAIAVVILLVVRDRATKREREALTLPKLIRPYQ